MQFETFLNIDPSKIHHAVLLISKQFEQHQLSDIHRNKITQHFSQIQTANQHPDILIINPDRNILRLEDVQKIKEFCLYPPQIGSRRIVFLENCERLNLNSANFLLKSLEEPNANTLFILTTDKVHRVIPTVLSRLQKMNLVFSDIPSSNFLEEFDPEDNEFFKTIIFNLSHKHIFAGKSLSDAKPFSVSPCYLYHLIEKSDALGKKYNPHQLQAILLYWISERLKKERTFVIIARFIVKHIRNWKEFELLNPSSQFWLLRIFLGQHNYENH